MLPKGIFYNLINSESPWYFFHENQYSSDEAMGSRFAFSVPLLYLPRISQRVPLFESTISALSNIIFKSTWHYIKQKFKNKMFEKLSNVKKWLHDFVKDELNPQTIISITHNKLYNNAFVNHLDI